MKKKKFCKQNEATTQKLRKKKLAIDKEMNGENDDRKSGKLVLGTKKSLKYQMVEKLNDVKDMIDSHVDNIHSSVMNNAQQTIEYVQTVQKTIPELSKSKTTNKFESKPVKLHPSLKDIDRLWNQVAQVRDVSEFGVSFRYPERSQPKITHEGSKSQKYTRLTSGEQLDLNNNRRSLTVDAKVDRFRRQNVKQTKSTNKKVNLSLELILIENFSASHTYTSNLIFFKLPISIKEEKFFCK